MLYVTCLARRSCLLTRADPARWLSFLRLESLPRALPKTMIKYLRRLSRLNVSRSAVAVSRCRA